MSNSPRCASSQFLTELWKSFAMNEKASGRIGDDLKTATRSFKAFGFHILNDGSKDESDWPAINCNILLKRVGFGPSTKMLVIAFSNASS